MEPRTSQKEVPQPPRVQTTRIGKHSRGNIENCIGSGSMSAPQSVQEMVIMSNQLGGHGSAQHPKFSAWFFQVKCFVTPFSVNTKVKM